MLWIQQTNGEARSIPSIIDNMIITLIVESLFEQVDEDSYRILDVSLKTLHPVLRFHIILSFKGLILCYACA